MKPLYFITGNEKKFAEARLVIPELEMLDADLPEIQHIDAKAIIEAKLKEAFTVESGRGAFAVEDTSLELDCLNGLPGPLIKWFLKSVGCEGIWAIADKFGNDRATARTFVGYAEEGKGAVFFEGVVEGRIVKPRADSAFGWDPIFKPAGRDKTFAEMSREEKTEISMRRKAFEGLKEYLSKKRTNKPDK